MTISNLSPIVRWAQNGPQIDITIDLSDVSNPQIDLTETSLNFAGYGHGGHGEDMYTVNFEFYNKIDYIDSTHVVTDRNVSFKIMKQVKSEEWPRLLKDTRKPAWLKIDFDKWLIESDEEDKRKGVQDEEADMGRINKISFEQRVKSEVEKAKDDLFIYSKVAWLSTYYLFQSICFALILGELIRGLYIDGIRAYLKAYDNVAGKLLTCQIAAFMEILHPIIGINKVGLRAPILNVCIRNFILFILIVPVKYFHTFPFTFILFFAWSLHEFIRFPHNLLMLHRMNHWILTWIRYSYWLLVYPVGIVASAIIVYISIGIADKKNRMVYSLPNMLNFSFSLSTFLKIFFFCFGPGCAYFLKHMWILRRRKIGRRVRPKQD